MKYKIQRATQIKKSTIIQAEADVESIKLIGKAVQQSPAFLTLQKIQAAKEIAKLLQNSTANVLLDSNILLMNQLQQKGDI
jgi:prohibitin 2